MPLGYVALFSLGIFAFLHLLAIPRIERQLRTDRSAAVIGKAGTLALLGFLRTVALVIGAMSVLILLAVASLRWTDTSTVRAIGPTIARAQRWRDNIEAFSPFWGWFVFLLLIVGMWILARRSGRNRVDRIFREAVETDLERLRQEREAGNWPILDPTSDMEKVLEKLQESHIYLAQLDKMEPQNLEEKTKLANFRETVERQMQQLQVLYSQLDVARRVQVKVDPDRVAYPPPEGWRQRVQYFLVSQGLMTSLRGGTRALFLAGYVLLVPALLGVQSGQIGDALTSRIVKLDDLRVTASQREAMEEWQEALRTGATPAIETPWTDEDEEAANTAAAQFENALSAMPQSGRILPTAYSVVPLRAQQIREQILRRAVASAPTSRLVEQPSFSEAPDLVEVERETLKAYEEAGTGRRPKTEAGRRMVRELRQVGDEYPGAWQRIKTSVRAGAASFQHPTTADDLSRMMLTRMMGMASEGAGGSGTELGRIVQQVDDLVGLDALRRAYPVRSRQYLSALLGGSPLDEAARLIMEEDPARPIWTEAEERHLKAVVSESIPRNPGRGLAENPPTLTVRPEAHVALQDAAEEASEVRRLLVPQGNRQAGVEIADALADYGDHFVGQRSNPKLTTHEALVQAWERGETGGISPTVFTEDGSTSLGGGGGGGGVGSGEGRGSGSRKASIPRTRTASFARARSFGGLRGFARVGGVLIGNEPSASKPLDFRDLRWKDEAGKLSLSLVNAQGVAVSVGAFRPTIVRQALTYVADGRPVTVTMVHAKPLAELKILLHPALVDTPLGCRAIEIDRFVDMLTGESSARENASLAVASHANLYTLAWAHRVKGIVESETASAMGALDGRIRGALAASFVEVQSQLSSPLVAIGAAKALRNSKILQDPKQSLIAAKPEFFDPTLVGYVKSCAAASSGGNLEKFGSCIEERTAGEITKYLPEPTNKWFLPPPEFQIWSGVREREYALDPTLSFLKPSGKGADAQLWPFDFMLQVAFTSAPLIQGQEDENYTDEKPWEFPSIAGAIRTEVLKGIQADGNRQSILNDMREFTVLQRLFRTALSGGLGERFPQEKLVALMDATKSQISKPSRTLRWNVRPGTLEFSLAASLESAAKELDGSASSEWMRRAVQSFRSCVALVRGTKDPVSISQPQWLSRCSFESFREKAKAAAEETSEPALTILGMINQATYTSGARKIRKDLGVQVDDRQALQRGICPAV